MEDFKILIETEKDLSDILLYLNENGVGWSRGDEKVTKWDGPFAFPIWLYIERNKLTYCYTDSGSSYLPRKTFYDLISEQIIISRFGTRTFGVHVKDGKVQETSIAKCHPSDEFNLKTGAEICLDRLFNDVIQIGDFVQVRGDLKKDEIEQYIAQPYVYESMKGRVYGVSHTEDGSVFIDAYEFKSEAVHKVKFTKRNAKKGEYVRSIFNTEPLRVCKRGIESVEVFEPGKTYTTLSDKNYVVIEGYVQYQKELHMINSHGIDSGKLGEPAGFDDAVGRKLHIGDEVIIYDRGNERGSQIVSKGKSGITVLPYNRDKFLSGELKLILKKEHTKLKAGDIIFGNRVVEV